MLLSGVQRREDISGLSLAAIRGAKHQSSADRRIVPNIGPPAVTTTLSSASSSGMSSL